MVRASCLCGDIAWESSAPFELMSHCHCSICRKCHGAAFGTYVMTDAEGFRWLRGEERIAHYESSPGFDRPFCPRCGSQVASREEDRAVMPAGCLDDDPGVRPLAHIFTASKAPWHEICDELPRFDAYPPGFGGAEVVESEREPGRSERIRGSCVCGAIAYELAGQPELMVNCHCSRCRKSRAAAHATNLLVPLASLHWIRGEEEIRRFEVPDAKLFGTAFCGTCGSLAPRGSEERGLAVVPAGGLDDDPGARERLHIYVGSKAPWFEIEDDLPRFEESPPGH